MLAALSLAYAALFVPANSTGSANVNMLAAFKLDEFSQYHALWRMTEPAESLGESLRQVVAYDYYYYGFPFFGMSALAFWPLRWVYTTTGEPGLTWASMLVLRELSVLLNLGSILLLVGLWTGYRSAPRAAALFVFLAALPAVVADNLWWHSDALVTFFAVTTLALLVRDRLRLGPAFYAAAASCGLATATKLMGPWFGLAVALHLLRALPGRPLRQGVAAGAGFSAVMLAATLAASPMLFVPGEAAEVGETIAFVSSAMGEGWGRQSDTGLDAWLPTLRAGFGAVPTLLLLIGLCALTAWREPRRRDLALTILTWAAPMSLYVIGTVAYQCERYLQPVLLPLASCAASPLWLRPLRNADAPRWARAAAAGVALLLGLQLLQFVRADVGRYTEVLERERTSPSLAFERRLAREVLADLPAELPLRVLRDPYVYLPPHPRFEVHLRWGRFEAADLREVDPDLVLLRREVLEDGVSANAPPGKREPERAARSRAFYRDALRDALPGYRLLVADDFGLAFGRTASAPLARTDAPARN